MINQAHHNKKGVLLTSNSAMKEVRSSGEALDSRYLLLLPASWMAYAGVSASLMPKYCIAPVQQSHRVQQHSDGCTAETTLARCRWRRI